MKVLGVDVAPAQAEKEPVLDMPAIDMTESGTAAQPRSDSEAPGTKTRPSKGAGRKARGAARSTKSAAAVSASKATKVEKRSRRRDGSVGRETFAAVEALIRQGRRKKEAFAEVAEASGRSQGTIATTYYRVAGQNGGARRNPGSAAGRTARGAGRSPATDGQDTAAAGAPSAPGAAKASAQKDAPKRTREGSAGREIFAAVEALVATGVPKMAALKQVAADTGRSPNTVTSTYYRLARAAGPSKSRRPRAKASPQTSTRGRRNGARRINRRPAAQNGNSGDGVDQVIGRLLADLRALTEAVKAQDAEVRELRDRLEGVPGLLE
jgi:hypothetical protein